VSGTVALTGGRVVGPFGLEAADVIVSNGVITSIGPPQGRPGATGEVLDAKGLLIAPGFVDLQCNGGYGIDLAMEPERLWELAALLPRQGVTSFLPTIVSSPPGIVDRALSAIRRRPGGFRGAEPIGLHLEGPMLNPARRGAHVQANLRSASLALIEGWSRAAGVAMVTLAPELRGALEVIRTLRHRGVVVSAGHTDATTTEMVAALDAGVTMCTHLFNAMAPFAHREPGPVGVTLADERITAGLIVDGLHVHPTAVAAAWTALGPNRLAIVTDSVATPEEARTPSGRLAGSVVPIDEAVRNLVAFTRCSSIEAVGCASTTPARLLAAATGRVVAGAPADLVLLTSDLYVAGVVVAGAVFAPPFNGR
jgi:N-acetylglucosamine-6-phosphate deacetylase